MASKKKKVKAEVRATYIETKDFVAKRGDVVEIPADEKEQSPAVKHALKSGNLVIIDLKPVTSEEIKE
ncbi:hypothetical protein DRP05_13705 [Archaeoglobales archaeon]|nr:MAG: hypothetical protein DRP05_13705 [Archaeoglobales archaeon]